MAAGHVPELQGIAPDGTAQPVQGIDPFLFPDERSDKENMENQRDFLKERMESKFGLLDKLLKIKSLSVSEISEIKSKATTFEKNGKLLELIFEKNNHQDLIRALTETSQMHLVNWIRANGEYRIEFHLEWPLREKEIGILNDNQEIWTDNLDAYGLPSLLFSKKVINNRQMDFVQSKQTSYEKNEELLTILRRCSLAAYFTTVDCLRASNRDHIADILEGKGAVVQVHANLDGERLDEIETQIVRGMASLLLNIPENRTNLLLQELQIRLLAARRGSSIVLYIYCKTMDELTYLCKIINNKELKDRIEKLFNSLLRDMVTKVIDLYIVETEIDKAKKRFEREAIRDKFDEDILKLRAQKRPEKKLVESVGGDDGDGYVRGAGFSEVHATGFFMKEKELRAEGLSFERQLRQEHLPRQGLDIYCNDNRRVLHSGTLKAFDKAVSKLLGLPTTDPIRKHKNLREQLEQQENSLNKINAILNDLEARYNRHKHSVFFIRYKSMKRMIKSAVNQMRTVHDVQTDVRDPENARAFAENAKRIAEQEKYYSELTLDQLETEMRDFEREIPQKEAECRRKNEVLDRLDEDYKNSKTLIFHRRYKNLKKMIKDTISGSKAITITIPLPQ